MGDLFFILKMTIYTVVLVVVMQVKVGPTTLEQKVIEWTHHSQVAGTLQRVAQGAASFVGVQYRNLTGHIKSRFVEQHSSDQIPGERLRVKIDDLKESLKKTWKDKKDHIEDTIQEDL